MSKICLQLILLFQTRNDGYDRAEEGGEIAQSLLVSNEPAYVNHFKSIFEELWKNGIDALDRIRDIEKGDYQADIEIISNPKEGIKRAWRITISKRRSIDIVFFSECCQSPNRYGWIAIIKRNIRECSVKVRV